MLKNVIENYLSSIKELQFFLPFNALLEGLGFYDIHLLHGPTEFGKDFIAKKKHRKENIQYCLQIKVGDISYGKFTEEVKPQLLEIVTNNISHPNFDKTLKRKIVFVTTGIIKPPATISFQEFNNFLESKLNSCSIIIWEKNEIINRFLKVGLEPFFNLHDSPEFVSRFFELFSNIKKGFKFSSFDIVSYTDEWLKLDFNLKENKLQILFETYFFSKLFEENNDYYNSILFQAALARKLIKENIFSHFEEMLLSSVKSISKKFIDDILNKNESDLQKYLFGNGIFSIFSYPIICFHALDLFSVYILLNDKVDSRIFEKFIDLVNEKGSTRPISDNYAITIVIVSLSLIKLNKIETLKKYINNITVWLCDRYEQNGIAPIGYKQNEEIEHILSEYLDGLLFFQRKTSFIGAILLDICFYLNDKEFYSKIANDLKAVEIIPEYYLVNEANQLFNYDQVVIQSDHDFSIELIDNYTNYISFRKKSFFRKFEMNEILFLMILLKDRYFPEIIFKNN